MVMVIPRPGTTVEEVHCHNKTTDDAVTLIIDSSYDTVTCKIPDTFLTTSNDLVFYAVMKDDTGKYTTEKALFKVIKRPKPSDYVYTEEEVREWELLNSRMSELEQNSVTDSWNYTRGMLIGENEAIKDELIPDDILRKRGVSWEDVHDRPFGCTVEKVDSILSSTAIDAGAGEYIEVSSSGQGYSDCMPYNSIYVEFDGKTYACSIANWGGLSISSNILVTGNQYLADNSFTDDGIPFCIYFKRSDPTIKIYVKDQAASHIIEAYKGVEVVNVIDEKFIPETIARKTDIMIPDDVLRRGGVVWSDITDRPFGHIEVGSEFLSWDGDTTGLVTDSGGQYFKVSGVTPKSEDFKNKPAEYCYVMEDGRDHSISGSGVNEIDNVIDLHGYCIIVSKDGAQYEERTFPEAGTYFKKIAETHYCFGLKIVGYTGFPYVKCIDDVYLSENISREGHTHDWELLENKPVVETCEFEFSCDGNTEGLTMLYGFAKISDLTPALEDFQNGLRIHRALGDIQDYVYEDVTVGNMFGVNNLIIGPGSLFIIIPEGTIGPGGTTFEKGIYFCNQGGYNHTVKVGIKQRIRPDLIEEPNTEEWVFTLEDGSTVTKKVAVIP